MSFSATIAQTITIGGKSVSKAKTLTASASVGVEETVAGTTSDYNIVVALDQSEIEALYISADQALTLETQDGTSADVDTIVLVADEPLVWYTGSLYTSLITADLTDINVSNASGTAATLQIYALQDATP